MKATDRETRADVLLDLGVVAVMLAWWAAVGGLAWGLLAGLFG